jgi:hypothetical protein
MFYEKLAEAKEEKKRRLSGKQKLGLGLGAAGLLTAGILGRKRIGAMFGKNTPTAPGSPKPIAAQINDAKGAAQSAPPLHTSHAPVPDVRTAVSPAHEAARRAGGKIPHQDPWGSEAMEQFDRMMASEGPFVL